VLSRIGHPFEEVDIESDDELLRRYLERIPVVALDGQELFDYFVDEPALRELLAQRGAGGPHVGAEGGSPQPEAGGSRVREA
jgi:hypothetical protein